MYALIAIFCEFLRAGGSPQTTIRARREHLQHMASRIGTDDVTRVTASRLQSYFAAQRWAAETRRGRRATLVKFWAWLVDTGRVASNVAEALPACKAGVPAPRPCPENAYLEALVKAKARERLMLRLSAEMGLRRAEVAGIHAKDIFDDLGGKSLIVHGKGAKTRYVPLPAGLALELVETCNGGYAFPGNDDGHLSPRWVGKLITRLLPEGFTMHTLRHRFASRAWSKGVDIFVIQNILGHASSETTRRYVVIPRSAERAAIDLIA